MPAPVIAHGADYITLIPILAVMIALGIHKLRERRRGDPPPDDEEETS